MTYPVGSITGFIRIAGAAQADRDLARIRAGMAGAGEAAGAAAGALGRTDAALAATGRSASTATAGAAKYRAAQLSAVAATERYNTVLMDENASLARVASAEAAVIRANERLRATTPVAAIAPVGRASETAASGMGRFGAAMGSAGKMAVGLGLTLGAFELVKKAIDIGKQAANFQREMLLVQTQAGASAVEVRDFSAAVLSMAGDVATAPDKLANSLYHAYSVGLRGATALQAIKIAAEGAKVGNADLEQTTNALTAAVASGIPGVQNMAQAMGALNTIVGAGDMNLEQLNEALGSGILVVAKQFGVSLTDVGAALATFGDNNIRGAQAATTLRVAINAMAKPVAGGADELAKLGLNAKALATDMQHGGLNQALHDLKDHLTAAGITGNKVGDVLLTAFGKKAGPGVSVLVDQLSRFDQKTSEIEKGAGSFGDRWKATTQTASFAFQKLGAQIEAGGIVLANKLMPAVTTAAQWLGTNLPHALSVLGDILGPIMSMVGTGLAGAWHAVVAVLGPVTSMLGSVGHFLADNSAAVRDATALVLGLWAAYKGYVIGVAAYRALTVAVATYRAALISTSVAAPGFAANLARFVTAGGPAALAVAGLAVAVGVLGSKISGWIEGGRSSVAVLNDLGNSARTFTAALDAANGALDENVAKSVAKQLQDTGLADKAKAAGISLNELTYGITHGSAAFDSLVASWRAGGKPSDDTIQAARAMATVFGVMRGKAVDLATVNGKLGHSQQISATAMEHNAAAASAQASAHKALAQELHWVIGSSGNLVQTTGSVAKASDGATKALQAQTQASSALKLAQDLLNGVNQSVETSTDALSIGLGNLANKSSLATDANGKATASLKQSTVAGATNRQMLVGMIDLAKAQAQATADMADKTQSHGRALMVGNAQLKKNEDAIRAAAKAAGMDKGEVDKLIGSVGILSKLKADPKVTLDTAEAKAKAAAIQAQIDSFRQHHVPLLKADPTDALHHIADIQNGLANLHDKTVHVNVVNSQTGNLGPKLSASGGYITGPGSGTSDSIPARLSNGEYVINARQTAKHLSLLNAINRGARGFASGGAVTPKPDPLVTRTVAPMWSGIQGIAEMLHSQIPGAARAMSMLSRAVNDAFTLKGVQSQLASARVALADMAQKVSDLRTGVTGALRGAFDPTKYGSVTDLLSGFGGATAANKTYAADVAHAGRYGLSGSLLRQLEASGNTATLDALGHASKAQIAQVNKAYLGFSSSVAAGADTAIAQSGYAGPLAADAQRVQQMQAQQAALVGGIDRLLVGISKLTGHKAQILLDGKVISEVVVHSREMDALVDELGHHVLYGRKH